MHSHRPTPYRALLTATAAAIAVAGVSSAASAQVAAVAVADRPVAQAVGPGDLGERVDGAQPGGSVVDPDEVVRDRDGPQVPLSLTPVDRWREDPTVAFEATDIDLEDLVWIARPIVVFADSPVDPAFQRQVDLLLARAGDLVRRDVVVITDTDPAGMSEIRRKLRPRGFMLVLIGKDGEIKLQKPLPWDVREIGRVIDKMPLRLQELRDERNANQ
jgi:hypothetical protein